jgi:hypothetical protein
MTIREAQEQAARLGLSAWVVQALAVGQHGQQVVDLMCVGFVSADLPIAEAETWEEALQEATRIIFDV